jgi:hypothetical protein
LIAGIILAELLDFTSAPSQDALKTGDSKSANNISKLEIGIIQILFYPCDARLRTSTSTLFKTISASVYGIYAYFVEVEVDVGSARMQDFNVVGLPDNAVKESWERIKGALRSCGY